MPQKEYTETETGAPVPIENRSEVEETDPIITATTFP